MPEHVALRPNISTRRRRMLVAALAAAAIIAATLVAPMSASASETGKHPAPVGAITGTVSGIRPIVVGDTRKTEVSLYNLAGTLVDDVAIGRSGMYAFRSVPAGSYIVEVAQGDNDGWMVQWYSNATQYGAALTRDKATVITLRPGVTLKATDVYLQTPSSVTGTVTAKTASGTVPVPNLKVAIYNVEGRRVASGITLGEGNYRVRAVPAGVYFVKFDPDNTSSFVPEWLGDKATIYGSTRVTVTANKPAERVNATLAPRPAYVALPGVTPIPFTSRVAPVVTGTASVRQSLHASAGSSTPSARSLNYQWLRNGVAIVGATTPDYRMVQADAGFILSIRVTGTRDGYTASSMTSKRTAMVTGGEFKLGGSFMFTGTLAVGETLSLTSARWSPQPTTIVYQWTRNGVVMASETGATYRLTPADLGGLIMVKVIGFKDGYNSMELLNDNSRTDLVLPATVTTPTPRIEGSANVGNQLSVTTFTWAPASTVLTYAWLRDGERIPGATGSTYKLVAADQGALITVAVTGAMKGGNPVTTTSKARSIR